MIAAIMLLFTLSACVERETENPSTQRTAVVADAPAEATPVDAPIDDTSVDGAVLTFLEFMETAGVNEILEYFPEQQFEEVTEFEDETQWNDRLVAGVKDGSIRFYQSKREAGGEESFASIWEYIGTDRIRFGADIEWLALASGQPYEEVKSQLETYMDENGAVLRKESDQPVDGGTVRDEIYAFKKLNYEASLKLGMLLRDGEVARWLDSGIVLNRYAID